MTLNPFHQIVGVFFNDLFSMILRILNLQVFFSTRVTEKKIKLFHPIVLLFCCIINLSISLCILDLNPNPLNVYIFFPQTKFLFSKWLLAYSMTIGCGMGHFKEPFITDNSPNMEEKVRGSG